LTTLCDHLKAGLSGATPQPGREPGPRVSELAERIKALKAAHSIEATPQGVRQKQSTAEEPVTARIRRRTEALPAADPVIESGAASSPETAEALESLQNSSRKLPLAFQECIAMVRQRKDDGPEIVL